MTPVEIIRDVESVYCLRRGSLAGRNRTQEVCDARRDAVERLWHETDLTLRGIGLLLGGRDHSTITHYLGRARLRDVA